ncbi:MAG TPA: hypothetical protein VFZ08_13735 [Terriglobia bacterium]|nr:hypothetical protein [Terriglobia bacterium]
MRWTKIGTIGVVSFLILTAVAAGQNAAKTPETQKPLIPLKMRIVLKDYKGAKELNSLPYTIHAIASERGMDRAHLRMGLRVPIVTGEFGLGAANSRNVQFQYQDVGTNIDCGGKTLGAGLFEIDLTVQRSFLYSAKLANPGGAPDTGTLSGTAPHQPIFSNFSTSLHLLMRDGQTLQSTMATDPVSGRVLKVDVTLHVIK